MPVFALTGWAGGDKVMALIDRTPRPTITSKGDDDMTATMTTAQLAEALDTTPRELRKFLRADAKTKGTTDTLPGKGSRYALPGTKSAIASAKKRFIAWSAQQDEARKARNEAKVLEDTVPDVEDETDTEPTDAELDEVDEEVED